MMHIPARLLRSDTVHRNLTGDPINGLLSCGFLHKTPDRGRNPSDVDICLPYYGGLLLLSGSGTHIDRNGRAWPLAQGHFVQRYPGRKHTTIVDPDGKWLEFYICLGRDLFESLVRLRVLDDQQEVLNPGLTPALLARFEAFRSACRQAEDTELPLLLSEAQHLLFTMMRMHRASQDHGASGDWIDLACRLIGEVAGGPEGQLTVEAIARQVGVGVERFRKGFRERTGLPPAEYLRMRRMNAAQTMLADGHRTVREIALALGFPDAFSFSRQFKQTVGVSPSRFRMLY